MLSAKELDRIALRVAKHLLSVLMPVSEERTIQPHPAAKDAYNIPEFCRVHGMSRGSFYNLKKTGTAPRLMQVGSRIMISKEAAEEWRRGRLKDIPE